MKGKLYVVGGPIGNLEDITVRAIRVLEGVEIILCEDTRRTLILTERYGIKKKLVSFHEHNEEKRIPQVKGWLNEGKDVALLSDSGMPTIQDPGFRLVRELRREGYEIVSIPGPSSVTAALSVSGLPTDRFVFEGFLPKRRGKRRRRLEALKDEERTIVFFISVHNIGDILLEILETLGDREVALCRELTKVHEEVIFGRLSEVIDEIKGKRGEFVAVVGGKGEGS
jgi:16S rRNA (cytidine1402-2'-O)-methyltransferase